MCCCACLSKKKPCVDVGARFMYAWMSVGVQDSGETIRIDMQVPSGASPGQVLEFFIRCTTSDGLEEQQQQSQAASATTAPPTAAAAGGAAGTAAAATADAKIPDSPGRTSAAASKGGCCAGWYILERTRMSLLKQKDDVFLIYPCLNVDFLPVCRREISSSKCQDTRCRLPHCGWWLCTWQR